MKRIERDKKRKKTHQMRNSLRGKMTREKYVDTWIQLYVCRCSTICLTVLLNCLSLTILLNCLRVIFPLPLVQMTQQHASLSHPVICLVSCVMGSSLSKSLSRTSSQNRRLHLGGRTNSAPTSEECVTTTGASQSSKM